MFKTIEEVMDVYKKEYIVLAAEARWHEDRPMGGLREANSDGRMRAAFALSDFKNTVIKLLGIRMEEMITLDAECERLVQKRLIEITNQRLPQKVY